MIHLIYITTKDKEQAKSIGKILLENRLAGCVNIIDKMSSMYWWEGKIQEDTEAILIVKTREELIDKVIEKVKEVHTYSCPCILAFPILKGSEEYMKWLEEETSM